MAKGDRAQKQQCHEYREGFYNIVRMSDNSWCVFDEGMDQDVNFKTLNEARKWCRDNPANPEFAECR